MFDQTKALTSLQVFNFTIKEIETALGNNISNQFDISVPAHLMESNYYSQLDTINGLNGGVLAHVFITNDNIAHVVYFPGVDTDQPQNLTDVPLSQIIKAVDADIANKTESQHYHSVKKYLTAAVYAKNFFRENHFVAITEIDKQLTVVNPKGKILANGTNPDAAYLAELIENFNTHPMAADIQGFDTKKCGYIVAAIHAKNANKTLTHQNFNQLMKTISRSQATLAYQMMVAEKENQIKTGKIAKETLNALQQDIFNIKNWQMNGLFSGKKISLKDTHGIISSNNYLTVPPYIGKILDEMQKAADNKQAFAEASKNIAKIAAYAAAKSSVPANKHFYATVIKKLNIDACASIKNIEHAIHYQWQLKRGKKQQTKTLPDHIKSILETIKTLKSEASSYAVLNRILALAMHAAHHDHLLRDKATQYFYESITKHLVISTNSLKLMNHSECNSNRFVM